MRRAVWAYIRHQWPLHSDTDPFLQLFLLNDLWIIKKYKNKGKRKSRIIVGNPIIRHKNLNYSWMEIEHRRESQVRTSKRLLLLFEKFLFLVGIESSGFSPIMKEMERNRIEEKNGQPGVYTMNKDLISNEGVYADFRTIVVFSKVNWNFH